MSSLTAIRESPGLDAYLARCALKTGKLFESACLLGAGERDSRAAAIADFGLALGVAFQIADDILDCTGEQDETGKLFQAACLLGAGRRPPDLGEFGLTLGIAFQIADDILDCTGETVETGKIAGTDLREGTPTLPLLLAAREDAVVRRALAGGSLDGALVRVAASGALERSRAIALAYARRARACLNGELYREELEMLTHAVVNRES